MKIISETKSGFLVDVSHEEIAHILDKGRARDVFESSGYCNEMVTSAFVGRTINLAEIWTRLHDHIRLESTLKALRIDLANMVAKCDRIRPLADEIKDMVEPKKGER